MDEKKIQRINELARKAKSPQGLTPEEQQERMVLRQEYVAAVRRNLEQQLDCCYVLDENGQEQKLKKKEDL